MLQAENFRGMSIERSPQQRFVSVAVVVGLHLAVLAAILAAFKPDIVPKTIPPIHIFIPDNKPAADLPRPVQHPLKLLSPEMPREIPPPPLDIQNTEPQVPTIHNPPGSPTGGTTGVVIAARAIASTHTIPDYPPIDVRMGHIGTVQLHLSIDEHGAVVAAQVERSSGYESLDQAAINWVVAHWRYQPAMRDGIAVASAADANVTFRLTLR